MRLGLILLMSLPLAAASQDIRNNPNSNHGNRFEQLGHILPTPNEYRTASGAPGNKYWQQRADYTIRCTLDEKNLRLTGSETVTYFNNSPDPLTYLWLQLDENEHSTTKNANYQDGSAIDPNTQALSASNLEKMAAQKMDNGFGVNITSLTDAAGKPLKYTVNKTMMRVDLPTALLPAQKLVFKIDWNYKIPDRIAQGGRGGYEYFPEDGNHLFTMAQWFPRMCVYSDFQGWQNHQFTGRGEFALVFGNYDVSMTVPADHVVSGTGECQNYAQVLSPKRLALWTKAQTSAEPVEIATLEEATGAEKTKSTATKTWNFKAQNVRDFAWTSSRKFIWDALRTDVAGRKVMCMSLYPKEAYGLYRRYSTRLVRHTIQSYSKFSINYPYPVAQSVEAANGMEYPMICFNYGRTEKDGSYSEATKNGMIGVIIHEVGHNFFPMIINSDERQWSWMDEGLNTFVEYLTEELWDNKFPSRRGPAFTIADYMRLPKDQLEPIMTNSENIIQFGPNAYSKPATGLNILRETIMGRELFDFAFRTYAQRWAFKHPEPADFFRTMEDASGEDLDWFWRGWFYNIDPVDISVDSVKVYQVDGSRKLDLSRMQRQSFERGLDKPSLNTFEDISKIRNREAGIRFEVDRDTATQDFYYRYDRGVARYDSTYRFRPAQNIPFEDVEAAQGQALNGQYIYEVSCSNKGGMVMPLILEWTFDDGTVEVDRIPAQIWRKNENSVTKTFLKTKRVSRLRLDPMRETADINESNGVWPAQNSEPSKVGLYKMKQGVRGGSNGVLNPMQAAQQKGGK